MYTLFSKVQKSVLAKALGVLMIVALMFPAAAVAPLAFAEGEETAAPEVVVEAAPSVEVVSDVAPQQSVDESDKKVEETKEEVKDENSESVKGDEVISGTVPSDDQSESTPETGKVLGEIKVEGGAGPTCPAETMTIKSDGTETFNAGASNAVPTWVHPVWTSIPGAQWIWDAFNVSDSTMDQTQTFERYFILPGVATNATLKIASDNSYKVSVNSNIDVFTDAAEDNYSSVDTYTGDDTSLVPADLVEFLNQGGNTLKFEVKNWGLGGSTAESNPAGLIYDLDITYIPTKCEGDSKDGSITVTKVVANSDEPISSFPLFVNGTPVISGVATTFGSGVYNVTETNMPNYDATFSGACDSKGEITLNKGESVNCTITNTYVPPVTVGAYCGDGKVNPPWEQCDGTANCTAQCQGEGQCTDAAFAKVTIDHFANINGASGMTSDIYVGGNTIANKIPSGTWFMIHDGTNPIVDSSSILPTPGTGYLNVPGLAVQRANGQVFLGIYGGYAGSHDFEHVDGKLEFYNTSATGQTTGGLVNPKIENGFNGTGFGGNADTNDEVRIIAGVSEFSMTTNHNSDGFETQYAPIIKQCADITVIKHVTNDGQGTKVAGDFTMHLDTAGEDFTFPGSETGVTKYKVTPGAYNVWESASFGGYTGSMSADCSGTLALGDHKVCTVANDDTHYTAFCGDNILNQPWEQCDGTAGCTAQCQMGDQCTDKAFAQVNSTIHDTNVPQQLTTDVYVGGTNATALIVPTGAWFMIFDGTNYMVDTRTNGSQFFNVPGIAVQRVTSGGPRLITGIFGQNNTSKTTIKHAEGTVKFFNTAATSLIEGPGSMHMELGFNVSGFGGYNHSDDEVRLNSGVAEFSLSTNSQGDAFGTFYSRPQSCDEPPVDACPNDDGFQGDETQCGQGGNDDGGDDIDVCPTVAGVQVDQNECPTGGPGGGSGNPSGSTGNPTGSGSNTGQGGGSGGSGGGTGGGVVIIPTSPIVPTVLGATTDVGAGGGGDNGQVLGDSLAQTGMPLSFPMLLSVILAIATLIVTRKEKFV